MIYGGHFDVEKINKHIKELEKEMLKENFWDDKRSAEKLIGELNSLRDTSNSIKSLKDKINNALEMLMETTDSDILNIIENEINDITEEVSKLEVSCLLNGPYDKNDCVLEIHSGAGGTEACDWAMMLKRMYVRWCDAKGYKIELIDEQRGDEVGIKSSTIIVHGINQQLLDSIHTICSAS